MFTLVSQCVNLFGYPEKNSLRNFTELSSKLETYRQVVDYLTLL